MRRSWLGLMIATILASATWMACVGDEPSTETGNDEAGGPGSLDNACFGNGTCNSGLSCVSNVCVDLDGAVGNDSSTGQPDASTDSGFVCDAGPVYTNAAKIPCPAPEADCDKGTAECCAQGGGGSCLSPGSSCDRSSGANIGCVLPLHCDGGTDADASVCCISAPAVADFVDDTCPRTALINAGACQSSCSTGTRQACVSDTDCPKGSGTTCHRYQINYNKSTLAAPLVIGLCVSD